MLLLIAILIVLFVSGNANDLFSLNAQDFEGNIISLGKFKEAKVILIGNSAPSYQFYGVQM